MQNHERVRGQGDMQGVAGLGFCHRQGIDPRFVAMRRYGQRRGQRFCSLVRQDVPVRAILDHVADAQIRRGRLNGHVTRDEVVYRGEKEMLWKTNFAQLYLDTFDGLKLLKEKKLRYRHNGNVDTMFLLEKTK